MNWIKTSKILKKLKQKIKKKIIIFPLIILVLASSSLLYFFKSSGLGISQAEIQEKFSYNLNIKELEDSNENYLFFSKEITDTKKVYTGKFIKGNENKSIVIGGRKSNASYVALYISDFLLQELNEDDMSSIMKFSSLFLDSKKDASIFVEKITNMLTALANTNTKSATDYLEMKRAYLIFNYTDDMNLTIEAKSKNKVKKEELISDKVVFVTTTENQHTEKLEVKTNFELDDSNISLKVEGTEYKLGHREGKIYTFENVYVPQLSRNSAKFIIPSTKEEIQFTVMRVISTLDEYKQSAPDIDYKELKKNSIRHMGEYVKGKAKILQIWEEGDKTIGLMRVSDLGYGMYTDNVYFTYDGISDLVEDDILNFYGVVAGNYTYKSVRDDTLTVPSVYIKFYE